MFEKVLAVILIHAETELSVEMYAYMSVIVQFCQVCYMSDVFIVKCWGRVSGQWAFYQDGCRGPAATRVSFNTWGFSGEHTGYCKGALTGKSCVLLFSMINAPDRLLLVKLKALMYELAKKA